MRADRTWLEWCLHAPERLARRIVVDHDEELASGASYESLIRLRASRFHKVIPELLGEGLGPGRGHVLLLLGDTLERLPIGLHIHELPRLGVPLDVVAAAGLCLRSIPDGTVSTFALRPVGCHGYVLF